MKTHYELIGVNSDATKEEIKLAYRQIAKKLHPDVNKERDTSKEFKVVHEAYKVLIDEELRSQYDSSINIGGSVGSSDIFSKYTRTTEKVNGTNINHTVKLTLSEAVAGKKVTIRYIKKEKCDSCDGLGKYGDGTLECLFCDDTGIITETTTNAYGFESKTSYPCPTCSEERKNLQGGECDKCSGKGYLMKEIKFNVTIPKGTVHGQTFKVPEKGNDSFSGGKPGLLIITVEVEEDSKFKTEGNNLLTELFIPIKDFALGSVKELELPSGEELEIRIEKETQPGTELVFNGKGISGGKCIVKLLVDFSEWR